MGKSHVQNYLCPPPPTHTQDRVNFLHPPPFNMAKTSSYHVKTTRKLVMPPFSIAETCYPFEKGWGAEKVLAILKAGGGGGRGGTECFGVVLTQDFEVLAILKGGGAGGVKRFWPFKRGGGSKFYCLEGGAQQVLDLVFSHFVAPPPPPPLVTKCTFGVYLLTCQKRQHW